MGYENKDIAKLIQNASARILDLPERNVIHIDELRNFLSERYDFFQKQIDLLWEQTGMDKEQIEAIKERIKQKVESESRG